MSEHTKEPWAIEESTQGVKKIVSISGHWITRFTGKNPDDVKRIVACVNACAGLDNKSINLAAKSSIGDAGGLTLSIASMSDKIKKLEQQRDELHYCLSELVDEIESKNIGILVSSALLSRIKLAITKATK